MDIDKLKVKAVEYLKTSGLTKELELCLNKLVLNAPEDSKGFISAYFEELCSRREAQAVEAREIVGSWGSLRIAVSVRGLYRNKENQTLAEVHIPSSLRPQSWLGPISEEIKSHNEKIRACINLINDEIGSVALTALPTGRNRDATEEYKIISAALKADYLVRHENWKEEIRMKVEEDATKGGTDNVPTTSNKKPESGKKSGGKKHVTTAVPFVRDDVPDPVCPALEAHAAVSMAMASCLAAVHQCDFATILSHPIATTARPPLPLLGLLANGRGRPGKSLLIRRVLLMPAGIYDHPARLVADLCSVHSAVLALLPTRTQVPLQISEAGEAIPAFDRPEQFLDLVADSIRETGLEEKIKMVLDLDARTLFDYDKTGKYEIVTGQLKSAEELVTSLIEWVDKYAGLLVGLVDPLRHKESPDTWHRLAHAIGDRCWLMLRGVVREVDSPSQIPASVHCICPESHRLLESYISAGRKMADANQQWCMWTEGALDADWLMPVCRSGLANLVSIPGICGNSGTGGTVLESWLTMAIAATRYPGQEQDQILIFPSLYIQSDQLEAEVTASR